MQIRSSAGETTGLVRKPSKDLEILQFLPQFQEHRGPVATAVRFRDALQDAPAALAKLRPETVLVVAAKVANDVFYVNR